MDHLLEQLNAPILYALVGGAILLVVAMCVTFMVKSWRAGLRLGMDRAVLKKRSFPAQPLRCCLPSAFCWG